MPVRTQCRCGAVEFEFARPPIDAATCYCGCCRRAGEILGGLDGATAILDPDGGTPLVMFRKSDVHCVRGTEHLAAHRLSSKTPTRRAVATCCNTPMFLNFTKGHWLSWFWHPMEATGLPRPTREVNRGGSFPYGFVAKFALDWALTGFRVPSVDYVTRELVVPPVTAASSGSSQSS